MKYISFCFSFFFSLYCLAGHPEYIEIHHVKVELQRDINSLLKSLDPDAYAVLKLNAKLVEEPLPATPFSLKRYTFDKTKGRYVFESSKLEVFHRKKDLEKIQPALELLGASYGVDLEVSYSAWPEDQETAQRSVAQLDNDSHKGLVERLDIDPNTFVFASLLFLFLLSLVVGQMISSYRGARLISKSIESQNPSSVTAVDLDDAEVEAVETHTKNAVAVGESSKISQLSSDSLKELLYDCYWSQKDTYGKFVVESMTNDQKTELLLNDSGLYKYSRYLSDVSHVSEESYHDDIYYLNPLPLKTTSNQDLRDWCLKNPASYRWLSPMRKESLSFDLKQQMDLIHQAGIIDEVNQVSLKEIQSQPRALDFQDGLFIDSIDDESALLEMEQVSFAIMKKTLSLVWARELSVNQLSQCLRKCTAKEIAQALIGPKETLQLISSSLPASKLQLVQSFINDRRLQPSRQSSGFKKLHGLILQKVDQKDLLNENVAANDAA